MSRLELRLRKHGCRFSALRVNSDVHPHLEDTSQALLKPSEVAAQLGVSRSWLYDAAKTGRIPSIRIGGPDGPLRFVPDDLRGWIDDARARWNPGRPTVPTRSPYELIRPRSAVRRVPTPPSGQQSLL